MEFLFMSISLFDGVSSAGIPEPWLPSFIESAGPAASKLPFRRALSKSFGPPFPYGRRGVIRHDYDAKKIPLVQWPL